MENGDKDMKIIIVGIGKVGLALTKQLSVDNKVTVVDEDDQLVENIINVYDVMGVCGNGASYEVQKEAGVAQARPADCHHLQRRDQHSGVSGGQEAGVQHTIARIRNPEYEKQLRFMRRELGLSMAINPEKATAREIARCCASPTP